MNVDRAAEVGIKSPFEVLREQKGPDGREFSLLFNLPILGGEIPLADRWILAALYKTASEVNEALENYRFDEAAAAVYQFFWGSFCDWYLEIVKLRLDFSMMPSSEEIMGRELTEEEDKAFERKAKAVPALSTLLFVFESSLRMLSPFMPFITEEIWHAIFDGNPPAKSIALAKFPRPREISQTVAPVISQMALLQNLIIEIRALRKEIGVEEKATVPIEVRADAELQNIADENREIVQRLARVSEVRFVEQVSAGLAKHSSPQFDVAVIYERKIDVAAERDKLTKEIAKQEKIIASSERQLNNPGFTSKAPPHIVEGLKKQRGDAQQLLDKLRRDLDSLPPA